MTSPRRGRGHGTGKRPARRWSAAVSTRSIALDLEQDIFTRKDPKRIASSLKRSADESRRRKAEPFRSAMSMLTFYINRAGTGLSRSQRRVLERAKDELRAQYGRPIKGRAKRARRRAV